jgi:diguanylate cyclase
MVWVVVSMVAQCALLIAVIWFILRTRSLVRVVPAEPASPAEPPQARSLSELLTTVSRVLAEHADELGNFERSLHTDTPEVPDQPELLEDRIHRMRSANETVEKTVDDTLEHLVAICGEQLSAEQSHLEEYQGKTRKLDRTLATVPRDELLAGIATKLLDMVQELRKENKIVREEVVSAKDQTIEFMARAHAAEQVARVDALTQLPNRRAFDETFIEIDDAFQRSGHPFSLILLDIDHFKTVNDSHGHAAGDAVLSMIGRVLLENRRTTDHISRLGGEEFALLLPRCDAASARLVADRYRQKLQSAKLRYNDQYLSVTVSGGVAEATLNDTKRSLLQRADAALYAAKNRGRNQVCVAETPAASAPVTVTDQVPASAAQVLNSN